jgi:hypothetical protein
MSVRLQTAVAIARLKAAGYHVEHDNGIIYVRLTPAGLPDRLYERGGTVASRNVTALINKAAQR